MTEEQLKKANDLKNKMDKYDKILASITCELRNKKRKNEDSKKRIMDWNADWTLKKFFTLKIDNNDNKKAHLIPHYELARGIEIDVEEDFVLMVKKYFEDKKEQVEQAFKDLK